MVKRRRNGARSILKRQADAATKCIDMCPPGASHGRVDRALNIVVETAERQNEPGVVLSSGNASEHHQEQGENRKRCIAPESTASEFQTLFRQTFCGPDY
jgi:hypothetical protein